MSGLSEDLNAVAKRFRRFAEVEARGYCRFYEELSLRIARDEELLRLAANVQPRQPAPNVFFAAVQFLLLNGVKHSLAEHYARAGREGPAASGETAWRDFRSFCVEHAAPLEKLIGRGRTQTNEVGRSALLYPALSFAAEEAGGMPLFTIDAGASAGLNLLWDRYRYRYVFEDGAVVERGNADSRVFLECEIRGKGRPPLPEEFPAVARRIGIDLHPIDPADAAEACWLRSLLWPDRPERVERMELAIETARQDPPELVTGDAVDVLPALLETIPDGVLPCILNCWTLYQFTREMRTRLENILRKASRARKIIRISMEGIDESNVSEVRLFSYLDGEMAMTPLARVHPHGLWLEWNPDPECFSNRVL